MSPLSPQEEDEVTHLMRFLFPQKGNEWMKVVQSCLSLCDPMYDIVHGILQARTLEWVTFPFSRESSQPGIELSSHALQTDSLRAELEGQPKNTGVGSLSLLQGIFLTQDLNQGLLHCRWILYQLIYEGIKKGRWTNLN